MSEKVAFSMRRRPWNESEYESTWMSRLWESDVRTPEPERSVARRSFAMSLTFSDEALADDVSGVDVFEPLVDDLDETDSPLAAALAACVWSEQYAESVHAPEEGRGVEEDQRRGSGR